MQVLVLAQLVSHHKNVCGFNDRQYTHYTVTVTKDLHIVIKAWTLTILCSSVKKTVMYL